MYRTMKCTAAGLRQFLKVSGGSSTVLNGTIEWWTGSYFNITTTSETELRIADLFVGNASLSLEV